MENTTVRKTKINSRKIKTTLFIIGMLALPVLQFLVFFVFVNVDTVRLSFTKLAAEGGKLEFPTLHHYKMFFANFKSLDSYKYSILNSILVGLNDLVLLSVSLVFSYFFYKKIRGTSVFKFIFFLPSMISMVIYISVFRDMFDPNMGDLVNKLLTPVYKIFRMDPIGWIENPNNNIYLVMMYCLWVGTGYNILIMSGAMANLPEDVMEYSRLEGLSYPVELVCVVIPMVWPTISVGILSTVTTMFTLFLQIKLMSGGVVGNSATIGYLINSKVDGGGDVSGAAAHGLCFSLVAMPLIIAVRKILDKLNEVFGV